jgi:hypothetical protein
VLARESIVAGGWRLREWDLDHLEEGSALVGAWIARLPSEQRSRRCCSNRLVHVILLIKADDERPYPSGNCSSASKPSIKVVAPS